MFVVSKLFWLVAAPSNLLSLLLAVGVVAGLAGWRRVGAWCTGIGTVLLLLGGIGPLGTLLLQPLEGRFPPMPQEARAPYGIIVLGGGVDELLSAVAGRPLELNEAGDRITALIELARRFPKARLVFSGGSGTLGAHLAFSEAEEVRDHIARYGVDPGAMLFETRSRTTAENARFTAALVDPKPDEEWWLVTSAFHMPRAIGCFRRVGFNVRAYTVDFRAGEFETGWPHRALASEGLRLVDVAVKEWIGLVAYRLLGETDTLLPGPVTLQSSRTAPSR